MGGSGEDSRRQRGFWESSKFVLRKLCASFVAIFIRCNAAPGDFIPGTSFFLRDAGLGLKHAQFSALQHEDWFIGRGTPRLQWTRAFANCEYPFGYPLKPQSSNSHEREFTLKMLSPSRCFDPQSVKARVSRSSLH